MTIILKVLKILVILSYLAIQIRGEQVAGPLVTILAFALTINFWPIVLVTILIWTALILLAISIQRKVLFQDKYLLPLLFAIMSIPVLMELDSILEENRWTSAIPFKMTAGLFSLLAIATLFLVMMKKNTATNHTHPTEH